MQLARHTAGGPIEDAGLRGCAGGCVGQVALRQRIGGQTALAPIARRYRIPAAVLAPAFSATVTAGYLAGDETPSAVTDSGRQEMAKLAEDFRARLTRETQRLGHDSDEQFRAALAGLACRMVDDDPPSATSWLI